MNTIKIQRFGSSPEEVFEGGISREDIERLCLKRAEDHKDYRGDVNTTSLAGSVAEELGNGAWLSDPEHAIWETACAAAILIEGKEVAV